MRAAALNSGACPWGEDPCPWGEMHGSRQTLAVSTGSCAAVNMDSVTGDGGRRGVERVGEGGRGRFGWARGRRFF